MPARSSTLALDRTMAVLLGNVWERARRVCSGGVREETRRWSSVHRESSWSASAVSMSRIREAWVSVEPLRWRAASMEPNGRTMPVGTLNEAGTPFEDGVKLTPVVDACNLGNIFEEKL
ncbi:helicase [Striga asiatica]|uniref:Helicase n=1 Tax=Striga asiatica TaxID=4170 RepID=A0A5A7Q5X9_STRAF|nr:helicase [Striga asiatica]